MLRNYLLVAIRNLMRHKAYSFINIVGLAVGIVCCILILLFVQDELSYDQFHDKLDRIHGILRETRSEGQTQIVPRTSGALYSVLANEFPEVEQAVRTIISREVNPAKEDCYESEKTPLLFSVSTLCSFCIRSE